MFEPTQVILSLSALSVINVERNLLWNENASRAISEEAQWRAVATETIRRVDLLQRALGLVVEALDLAAEPLRRIEDVSVVTEEGDSSESEAAFEECSSE